MNYTTKNRWRFTAIMLTLSVLLCLTNAGKAQQIVLQDIDGKPLLRNQFTNIDGSPFLLDDWLPADISFRSGGNLKDFNVKYDVINDALVFLDQEGNLNNFKEAVKSFKFTKGAKTYVFDAQYPAIDGHTDLSYYQILFAGKLQLIKKYNKVLLEPQNYNSANVAKKVQDIVNLYVYNPSDKSIVKLKQNESFLAEKLLIDDGQLKRYLKDNKVNLKKEDDLVKLFELYAK